jgi:hypothetical protein
MWALIRIYDLKNVTSGSKFFFDFLMTQSWCQIQAVFFFSLHIQNFHIYALFLKEQRKHLHKFVIIFFEKLQKQFN